MKSIMVALISMSMLIGCQVIVPKEPGPPSLKLVPANYYHYRYSKRLKKQVREIIPAEDLTPVPEDVFDQAEKEMYKAQKSFTAVPK